MKTDIFLDFVRDSLSNGNRIASLVAERFSSHLPLRIRAIPSTVDLASFSSTKDLRRGGVCNREETIRVLVAEVADILGHRDKSLVVENLLAAPSDPCLKDFPGLTITRNDQVYHYADSTNGVETIKGILRRASLSYHFTAFIAAHARPPMGGGNEDDFVERTAQLAETLYVGAFDGEGYLACDIPRFSGSEGKGGGAH